MKKLLAAACILMITCGLCGCEAPAQAGDSLAKLAEDDGFKMGAAFSYGQMRDSYYLSLVKHHFNSVTPTNELKAYSLLDQRASQRSAGGSPQMNFTKADQMLTLAQENGIAVRGHVLVWDAYMLDWFFRVDYDTKKPYADRETMLFRLQSYIEQVLTHFEVKFPGLIYSWDVVNEAVGDSAGEYEKGDARRLRTVRSGARNPFYDCVGDDYVELSFLYAKDAAEKLGSNITLFYNDYNAFMPEKRDAICALVDSVNSFATDENGAPRKLLDGVGMQGYIGGYGTQAGCLNDADLPKIKAAIEAYATKGVQVQITEMAVRTYENDEQTMEKHAAFYGKLFKLFASINKNDPNRPLTSVSIWGLYDNPSLPKNDYSYMLLSPYGGLFTQRGEGKACLTAVLDALRGE